MRTIFNMLRVPNLLIIAFTFLMLRYLVFIPVYSFFSMIPGMGSLQYLLMITATILIAAAGYISNDYFDVVTDRINKPEKQYIGKQISPGSTLATALLLSFVAIILSTWLTLVIRSWMPAILLLVALVVVWWYAIRLKKSYLWGNIAVACMSAGTVAMAWILEMQCLQIPPETSGVITRIVASISIFAFLLTLLREILKDVEDIEGDRLIQCNSLPIVKGISFTKSTLFVITAITIILLVITQINLFQYHKFISVLWLLICVEIPLIWFVIALNKSQIKTEYHKLSTLLKLIMLTGILTLVAGQF
jgi:4-hydroxybenzoate polyprenyltransferase